MAPRQPHGLTDQDVRSAQQIRRDTRPIRVKLTGVLRTPIGMGVAGSILIALIFLLPAVTHIAPLLALMITLWASGGKRERHLPIRMPMSAGRKTVDYGNPLPGHRGFRKAQGMIYLGNAVEYGMQELWATRDDALTHDLILGTTGAGKTVSLTGSAANYISMGGGLIYTDAKAAKDLPWTLAAIAQRCGREDDFLIINYMTGNRTIGRLGGERMTNTANPFAHGSADDLVQILSSLIPTPEGDNAVFGERALTMLNAELYALVNLRDEGYLDLGVGVIREYLPLEKLETLIDHPGLKSETAKAALIGYLHSLPNWKPPKDRQQLDRRTGKPAMDAQGNPILEPPHEEANRQHGFAQMYFTRALSSLTDTYGHIYQGTQGEVDFIDTVRRRRILATLLPALEKSPAELANLGKINLSAIKSAIGSSLGSALEGTRSDVLESLPTSSPIPSKIINDEYGYMSVDGFAVVAAQARGLGFSVTFAGQDWAGIQRGGKGEADQVWSNTRIKYFGKLLDQEGFERLQKAAGEAYTTESSGFELRGENLTYADSLSAGIQLRSRVSVTDVQDQNEGEAHVLIDGKLIRAVFFYPAITLPSSMIINRYLRVGERVTLDDADPAATDTQTTHANGEAGGSRSAGISRHVKQAPLPEVENNIPRDMGVVTGDSPAGREWRKNNPDAVRNFHPEVTPDATRTTAGSAGAGAATAPATSPATSTSTLTQARGDDPTPAPQTDSNESAAPPHTTETSSTPAPAETRPARGWDRLQKSILDGLGDDDTEAASETDSAEEQSVDVPDAAILREGASADVPAEADDKTLTPDALERDLRSDLDALVAGAPLASTQDADADAQPAETTDTAPDDAAGPDDADRVAHLAEPDSIADMSLEETFAYDTLDSRLIESMADEVVDQYPTPELDAATQSLTPDSVASELQDALTQLMQGSSAGGARPGH